MPRRTPGARRAWSTSRRTFAIRSAAAYEAVYQHAHGAPARLPAFTCAVPEHLRERATPHVAHPGCFATAALLASVPLLALGAHRRASSSSAAITGSTGSGRKPVRARTIRCGTAISTPTARSRTGTRPEISACALAATGVEAEFAFVPHSGPFARGIHATVQARCARRCDSAQLLGGAARVLSPVRRSCASASSAPRVKEVVASNYAQLSAVSDGRTVAVMCVLDNLNKGAAGGAVQWMNRLYGLPETAGLTAPAPGWT